MTDTLSETTMLDTLPRVTLSHNIAGGLTTGMVMPFVHLGGRSAYAGAVLAPGDTEGTAMWRIGDARAVTYPELAPYVGSLCWIVTRAEIDHIPPVTEPEPVLTPVQEFVPREWRSTIPEGARLGTVTGRDREIRVPNGRYLMVPHSGQGGDVVVASWPGHPEHTRMYNRVDAGVPLPWHGFVLSSGFTLDPEPVVGHWLAEVPEEHRHVIPEGARWGRTIGAIDAVAEGRFLAVDNPTLGEHPILITWPGHPQWSMMGSRAHYGVPLPLHGWNTYGGDFVYDPAPTPEPTPVNTEEVQTLRDEVERLQASLSEARAQVTEANERRAELAGRYDTDLTIIGNIMREEAEERDWCGEYEGVMTRINNAISAEIETAFREVEVTVDICGTVTVPWTASISVTLPRNEADEREAVESATRDWLSNNYISEANCVDIQSSEVSWDTVDDDAVEVCNFITE